MEEVGTQVASPMVIHQLGGRFCNNTHPMVKKRNLPLPSTSFVNQNSTDNWNPKSWNWDSARFVAKPLQSEGKEILNSEEDARNLRLQLGGGNGVGVGGMNALDEQPLPPVSRPSKRVRSGSPGGANYPKCQVDNCKEDLSTAKDYHRRHKVCEVHSKATKALVSKEMQRFCQQCSRFHPLPEFDEGKRSCRRRLAGHNRRRRKTQQEDAAPRLLVPGSNENNISSDMDIVNLLAVLARAQGTTEESSGKSSAIPDKDQLIQILSKINSLPLPANLAAKLPLLKNPNGSMSNNITSGVQNEMNGSASQSTMNLLAVLSAPPQAHSSDAFENQSQPSTEESDSGKSKLPCVDQAASVPTKDVPCFGGERSSASYHSPSEDADSHVQDTSPSLLLQLFTSSPEGDSGTRKMPSCGNYLSSHSSNPSIDRSPMSSPPVVHNLFPMRTPKEITKHDYLPTNEGEVGYMKANLSNGCSTSLHLFGSNIRPTENGSVQSSPYQTGYTSSSGSDHSPSSLVSDAPDRTGRIVFKLFDKDPSQLPGSLRDQIYNWLSNSPSEMESYIRPGCIVLSLYLSMPSFAWDQLEDNLPNYVNSLIKHTDVDFWGNGRFLIHTDRQMVSHKDGKIRVGKSWGAMRAPELISVSPLAIVGGQETSLLLRGNSLTAPGTKINCTHAAEYSINEFPAPSCKDSAYDEISLGCFKINRTSSSVLGRCFIEVENSFRGTYFPVIIADDTICQELRLLEPEINGADNLPSDHIQSTERRKSKEEVLHFLDELGWLFQRKSSSSLFGSPDYRLMRLKFLLIFSVEHDFCSLVRTLLGIMLELNLGREGLASESLEMLSEIHLLNRAVKRRCLSMVNMLVHYSIKDHNDTSKKFIFGPNMAGPGGVTPLHLAACTSYSNDIIDALTNDPQEVGLHSWKSVLDANGLSPYAYASMRNNHSYNALVSQKLADKENGQICLSIENEIEPFQIDVDMDKKTISHTNRTQKSCSKCSVAALRYKQKFPRAQGLLQRPYIHSMLMVAAVCVCVCVFLRGHPYIGCVTPFSWESLEYGAF